MKACAYCGRMSGDDAARCHECGTAFPVAENQEPEEPPPDLPGPKLIAPEGLNRAFNFEEGFHRADWELIRTWIDNHINERERSAAWNEAVLLWLGKVRTDLGGKYFVIYSNEAVLLCDQRQTSARWLLSYIERASLTIHECLAQTAWRGTFRKHVVLAFSDQDDYYQYLAYHTPEGEQPASGGVCIHSGLRHVVIPWQDENDAANAIVHELTHDCLAHLPLPLWLNEGVAVTLQKAIAPPQSGLIQGSQDTLFAEAINWRAPMMWHELAERHFAFWTPENIQSFWAGTSFYVPGDPNELSYSLAEVLVKLLSEKAADASKFRAFLESADQADAGQTAAMDILGLNLGEVAGTFLGKGDWHPNRKAMVSRWDAAGWGQGDEDSAPATPRFVRSL